MNRRIIILFALLWVIVAPALAQEFTWKAEIDSVKTKGYYNILLSPELVAKLNQSAGDIRLYNQDEEEVPYILNREKQTSWKTLFKEYNIIEKKHYRNKGYTRLVIHNPDKKTISNISLFIRNAEVTKWLKLNASDDNKNWYVLKDNYRFQSFVSDNETFEIKVLNFPNSNYEYYELLIEDYYDKPINIVKAGYYDYSSESGKYSQLPKLDILLDEVEQGKRSDINIIFPERVYFDRLEFDIEGAAYYYRKASVYVKRTVKKKRKVESYHDHVINFDIASFKENIVDVDRYAAKRLHINILNNDDKPLKVVNVRALLLNYYLTAQLLPGQKYTLRFGNEQRLAPIYDLEYFADSLNLQKNMVKSYGIERIAPATKDKEKEDVPAYIIWLVLGLIIIVLAYMSYKMLSDMKK